MLLKVVASGPLATNAYLLICSLTRHALIIDAPLGCTHKLLQHIEALSLSVQALLLTHSHWDHVADAAQLKRELHIPLYVHKQDAGNVESPGSDGLPLLVPIEGTAPDGFLEEGQLIQLGELTLKVLHTPGHSPGGVCFYLEKQGVLFSGDTVFKGTFGNLNLATASAKSMRDSLKRLATLPATTVMYPGHGASTTVGAEHWMAQDLFPES